MRKISTITLLFCLLVSVVSAQHAGHFYKISLIDKQSSEYRTSQPENFLSQKAIDRRSAMQIPIKESDLPVSPTYLSQLREADAEVVYTSKWLNTVIIRVDRPEIATQIARFPFIGKISAADELFLERSQSRNKEFIDNEIIEELSGENYPGNHKNTGKYNYGAGLNQTEMIRINELHELGFTGKGKTIGVIDAGYNRVDVLPAFDSLFANGQILGTADFVEPGNNLYNTGISTHGTSVLSTMGANLPGQLVGTAPEASYWLLRSEDAITEYIMEEYYWVNAAEFADSVGVDIINTSLGYNYFDNDDDSHTYEDMDGNTTVITIGADMAAAKGILVVVSAGNSGNSAWRFITAPADGDSVLTVGAVDPGGSYAYFSSIGPTADGRTKPEVAAQGSSTIVASTAGGVAGGSGTSFSAPIIAGAAACLWQANPAFNNIELINAIKMSASRASNPNNQIGWGIPNFKEANLLLTSAGFISNDLFSEVKVFPNPFTNYIDLELAWPLASTVEMKLMNPMGQIVSRISVELEKGKNSVTFNGLERHSSGIYLLQISDGSYTTIKKVIK